jgi:hypothetical protein
MRYFRGKRKLCIIKQFLPLLLYIIRLLKLILDGWNYFDIAGCLFFSIAFIFRAASIWRKDENLYIAARILFCIDLVVWYIRLLYITLLFKSLGPKIVMIEK